MVRTPRLAAALLAPLLALGLAGAPAHAQTVGSDLANPQTPNFDVDRFMGQWHEIARLDHPFQRGLVRVTSLHERQPDGSIKVVNRAVDKASGQPRESAATARILASAGRPTIEIDYGAAGGKHTYDVLDMAPDGAYALLGSTDKSALWILSRNPKLDGFVVDQLKARAISAGFSLDRLTMTEQGS